MKGACCVRYLARRPRRDDIALAIRSSSRCAETCRRRHLPYIPTGSFYGIVGPNGAGKTTTLTTAYRPADPDRGTAWRARRLMWVTHRGAACSNMPDGMRLPPDSPALVHVGMLHGLRLNAFNAL